MIRPVASEYFNALSSALSLHTKQGGRPEPTESAYSLLKYDIEPQATLPPQLELVWGDDEKHLWSDFQSKASEYAHAILDEENHMISTFTVPVTITKEHKASVITSVMTIPATTAVETSYTPTLVYQDKRSEPRPVIIVQITTNGDTDAETAEATSSRGFERSDGARVGMDVYAVGVCLVAILAAIAIL